MKHGRLSNTLKVSSFPRARLRCWPTAVSYDQVIHVVSISLSPYPDKNVRTPPRGKKTQNMIVIVLPMFTEFPLSPLLVSANELSGNVQRPFGIPLKRNNKSNIVRNGQTTNSHDFRFLLLIKK